MADKMDAIVSDLKEAITNAGAKNTKPYDTAAVVQRIDEEQGIAWVKIPGGVDETPVKRTIACSAGDTVQVRVSGGKAFIQGNASAPPTDDRVAVQARSVATTAQNTAQQAQETAEGVEGIATDAKSTANSAYTQAAQAKNIADTTNQYFWFSNGDLYFLSPDVEVDTSKTYYERTGEEGSYVYTAVTPAGTESPVSAGWYERFTETGAHITETPQDDFIADPENGGGNLLARSNGIAVRDGLTELSRFSASGMQIGQDGQTRIVEDYHSLQLIDREGNSYIHFSDLRNEQGEATIVNTYKGDGDTTDYTAQMTVNEVIGVTVDGMAQTYETDYTYRHNTITFVTAPAANSTIVITYICELDNAKAFTLGYRSGNSGGMSVVAGTYCTAEGYCSFASGYGTRALGSSSHAEGSGTLASDLAAHAEGNGAEAVGSAAHAEGNATEAVGSGAHAQNNGTRAYSKGQTALGEYNIIDNNAKYAVIVGNGKVVSDTAVRSNALTVAWDGEVEMYLDDTATSGTDYEIIQALTDLGWDSECIG